MIDIPSLKRKRAEVDAADPKLQEFLEVMQPVSKTKVWNSKSELDEPPTKMQALELPEGESDDEYEMVPKKARKESPRPSEVDTGATKTVAPVTQLPVPIVPKVVEVIAEDVPSGDSAETSQPIVGLDATDDDWLRSRTNRLLDLVEGTDAAGIVSIGAVPTVVDSTVVEKASAEVADVEMEEKNEPDIKKPAIEEPAETTDATMDAIRQSGRLFVRNLPYMATEDDLRTHFEKYGALEEVCFLLIFKPVSILAFMMNIQIGTAYASSK